MRRDAKRPVPRLCIHGDEVLLTGGTLARPAAEGHRVVIVVACDGVMGPAAAQDGQSWLEMLRARVAALGMARVEHLGYADSWHGPVLYPDSPDRVMLALPVPVFGLCSGENGSSNRARRQEPCDATF